MGLSFFETAKKKPGKRTLVYRLMVINQGTACMFAWCYGNTEEHLPANLAKAANLAKPANEQYVRVESDLASFFQGRERENFIQL